MKHVLSVQDLSCTGRCSLTVALPTLSAMGLRCTVLPTAVLSSHTGFPQPHRRSLTQDMEDICRHWQSIGLRFDAMGIGYLACADQAYQVEALLEAFPAFTVLDPVMGDHGRLYSSITPEHTQALRRLCRRADVVLPNVTEAALLTQNPYREEASEEYLRRLVQGLLELGAKAAVITGVSGKRGSVGFYGSDGKEFFSYQTRQVSVHSHGTGDLFAAAVLGGLTLGKSVYQAACTAAGFVERSLAATPQASPHGAEFEGQLGWLSRQTEK